MQMFESNVSNVPATVERGVQVFDLAELLEKSVAYGRPVGGPGDGGAPNVVEPAATTTTPSDDPSTRSS